MNITLSCAQISFQAKDKKNVLKKLVKLECPENQAEKCLDETTSSFEQTKDFLLTGNPDIDIELLKTYPSDYVRLSKLNLSQSDIKTYYEDFRKASFEFYKKCSPDVFKNLLKHKYDEKDIPTESEIMSEKEKEEYLATLEFYFKHGTLEEYSEYSKESDYDYRRFMISATNEDFIKYLQIIMPESSEISKNINAFMSFLSLASSGKSAMLVGKNAAKRSHKLGQDYIIDLLLNFKYNQLDNSQLTIDKRSTEKKFQEYLSTVKELYNACFSEKEAKNLTEMFQNSDSENAARLISQKSDITIDKSMANDIWINFIKSSMQNKIPISISIDGNDTYIAGFEDCKSKQMDLASIKGHNLQSLLECGFFLKDAAQILKLNKDIKSLSSAKKHELAEQIAIKYRDNRNFHNNFNRYVDTHPDIQKDMKHIWGLVEALDEKTNNYFNFSNYDIPKVSFSKHALLRLISRNLINPKHKKQGYVDFDSLLHALEAGLIKSKGQSFTIPELGGYSGMKVVVNDNQITTLF